jgi:hypothetical protein
MEVAVEDGLPGGFAVVGAEVEAGDGGVGGLEVGGEAFRQPVGGGPFVGGEVAEGGDVAAGDDEGVAGADGEAVAEGEAGAVFGEDALGGQGTEGAGRVHGGESRRGEPNRKAVNNSQAGKRETHEHRKEGGGKQGDWARGRLTGAGKSGYTRGTFQFGGQIAQLVEQWTENPCVIGSIPILATTFFAFLPCLPRKILCGLGRDG